MTTTMNDADRARFLQTLRSDPAFRDEVRSLPVGEELLQLPERFAHFPSQSLWTEGRLPMSVSRRIDEVNNGSTQ